MRRRGKGREKGKEKRGKLSVVISGTKKEGGKGRERGENFFCPAGGEEKGVKIIVRF